MTDGHADHPTADDVLEDVDLSGITAVVTGASSGIGRETARALAAAGATVVVAVRDAVKGQGVVRAIRDEARHGRVELVELDLTSLGNVRAAAAELARRHRSIDLLINNAGVMATPLARTTDGFELQFGTNHVGHFAFTAALAQADALSASARVVNLSSAGHQSSDIQWDDVNYERRPYDKWEAYGQSKTANILFSVELAARGVHANAVHPGMIATDLGRHIDAADFQELSRRAKAQGRELPSYKTIPQGAATTVWAAVAPELATETGRYLEDCRVSDNHAAWARDPASATRLWALSEELVGHAFDG